MSKYINNIKLTRFKNFSQDIALSILDIRNDNNIRKNMINDHLIKLDDHINWLKNNIIGEKNIFYIVYIKDEISGLVRFIINEDKAEWSYYLNKNCKNIYGAYVEYIAIEKIFEVKEIDQLKCQVLSFNYKVLSLHQKFGFKQIKIKKKALFRENKYVDLIHLTNYKKLWMIKREEIKKKLRIN